MDLESMMGLDKPRPAKARPKKVKKSTKGKGLLRSLRGSKKKSVENLLAAEEARPDHLPRRAQSGGSAERQRVNPVVKKAVGEGMVRRDSTVKKVVVKSIHASGADPVLVRSEGIVAGMRQEVAALAPSWPTAALKKALNAQRELLHFERTSTCDSIQDLVSFVVNTPDSLIRSSSDPDPDLNPYRASTVTKASAEEVRQNKAVEKDTALRKRQLQTTLWTFVAGTKAKYFWKSIETKLKKEDVRAIRIMYQRASFGFALDQLRAFTHSAGELGFKVDTKSRDVAHALLRSDSSKLINCYEDAKFVRSLYVLWKDPAIQRAFQEASIPPEKFQICTYMLDGLERILGPKYTPQSADFQYLQYLGKEKLRVIRMNHENSVFRFFGVDRVSGGTVKKWAPSAHDCVGMVVHMVDVSSIDSFNHCLQELADCLDQIRPTLAVLVFAFGFASLQRLAKTGAIDLTEMFPSYTFDKLEKLVKSRISRRAPSCFSGKFQVEFVEEPTNHDYYTRAVQLGNKVLVAQIHEVIYELTEQI